MAGAVDLTWPSRYRLFERCLSIQTAIANAAIYPRWIAGSERFWYDRSGEAGIEYVVIDAIAESRFVAFTHQELANLLGRQLGAAIETRYLVLKDLEIKLDPGRAAFEAFGASWGYDFERQELVRAIKTGNRDWLMSPDGRLAAFIRDSNLWVRDIATGHERALTTDGEPAYAYADAPMAMRGIKLRLGNVPEGVWSPDSRHFLTLQTDERHVPDLALTEFAPSGGGRPKLHMNRTSLPPDDRPTEFRILCVAVESGRQVEAHHPRLTAVRMNDTPFGAGLAWWSEDGLTAYFVDIKRGEQLAQLVAFDVATGATRVILSETSETYLELGVNVYAPALVFPLPASNEVIWYSERSGRGHLYLYDLSTGALKRAVTGGDWQIRDVQHVDPVRREVFFTAGGIDASEGPYVCKACVASLDADVVSVVSARPGDHIVWRRNEYQLLNLALQGGNRSLVSGLSPSGEYFVETIAGTDRLPQTMLCRRSGAPIMVVETAAARDLPPGWQWPEKIRVKAADGETDLYGLLFRPVAFDPGKTYPLIDLVYGGPQLANAPSSAFGDGKIQSSYGQAAGYGFLGAFCLILDGRGTGLRERAFREASYGRLETGSDLDDHVAAIRQLARHEPAIDLDRIGVTGFSCGGYTAALAALRHGDFFKVSVAAGGNYDQAQFWHCWGERYQGRYDADLYAKAAAKTYAAGLSAKLLLIHGLMDSGCHPATLFQLVQTLIEHNKDFDLVVLPRAGHEVTGYGYRRLLDYFVTHLFHAAPPPPAPLQTPMDEIIARAHYNAAPPPKRSACQDAPPDGNSSTVKIAFETPQGRIIAELYPELAPISVAGFLDFMDRGAFVGATFLRVIRPDNDKAVPPIEVIQAVIVDFDETAPGLEHETTAATGIKHVDGALSLARLAVGTGTPGTFFICVGDQPALDFGGLRNADGQGFAAFGRVVSGLDVVRVIQQAPTRSDAPAEQLVGQMLRDPVPILSVYRL